jgi:hypothetical protein
MKLKTILMIFFLFCVCFALDVSKVITLTTELKSVTVVAWPIECFEIRNCHEINREIHEMLEKQFNIKIISSDSVLSFFDNDVPSCNDVKKLKEFIKKYNIKFIIAPLIIDIGSGKVLSGDDNGIKEKFLLPSSKRTTIHLKESLKIFNAENGVVIARAFGEDYSRTNDEVEEILEVTEDLIKEILK